MVSRRCHALMISPQKPRWLFGGRLRPPRRGRGRPRDCRQGVGATDHLLDADFEVPPFPATGIFPVEREDDPTAAGYSFGRQIGVMQIPSAVFGVAVGGRLP